MSNPFEFLANGCRFSKADEKPIIVRGKSDRPAVVVTSLHCGTSKPSGTPKTSGTPKPQCPTCKVDIGLGNLYKKDGKIVCGKCRYIESTPITKSVQTICPTCRSNIRMGNLYKKERKTVCDKCRHI